MDRKIGLSLLLICFSIVRPAGAGDGFVILVNRSNPITSISRSDIKRTLNGGIKQWESGAVVQLGIIPNEAGETQYLASLVSLTPRELISRIQEQVFKGELRRPVILHRTGDCVAFARSSPGALCVATESEPVPPETHVLAIH
jgi:hypothetical protein